MHVHDGFRRCCPLCGTAVGMKLARMEEERAPDPGTAPKLNIGRGVARPNRGGKQA